MNTLKDQLMRIAPQVKANNSLKLKTAQGYIALNVNGFGFFKPNGDTKVSVFIPAKMVKGILPFDLVEVTWDTTEEKPRAQKVWIKKRLPRSFAFQKTQRGFVPMGQWNVEFKFIIDIDQSEAIDFGDVVVFDFDGVQNTPVIKVSYRQNLGPLSIYKNRHSASLVDALHPLKEINDPISVSLGTRTDLSDIKFLTVDGEFTKDFDDAVYVEKTDSGWTIYVAVADVAAVLPKNSELDLLAKEKGSTVYLPNDVRPMISRQLSEDLCSLIEGVVRPALVVKMNYDGEGNLIEPVSFIEATIKVHRRCTYEEVENWLSGTASFDDEITAILESWRAWQNTLEVKEEAIFPWRRSEHYIHIDENGVVSCVEPKQTPRASKMVEVAMVAANRAAARFLFNTYGLAAFRNHAEPNWEQGPSALEKEGWAFELPPKENAKSWWFEAFKQYENKDEAWVLARAWSKIQNPAQYQVKNDGHHALDSDAYTHFTSPIRRYADLEVHRAVKKALNNECYDAKEWEEIVDYCNKAMRRTKTVERQVKNHWMGIWWSQQSSDLTANARVKAVKKDGSAFVSTDVFGTEGIVSVVGRTFKVGDLIKVKFKSVLDGEIIFTIKIDGLV